jgi:hypothetical protein
VEKCGTAIQARDGGKAQAHCALDIQGYNYTLGIRNTYGFSTATKVTLKRLNITFVHSNAHKVIAGFF